MNSIFVKFTKVIISDNFFLISEAAHGNGAYEMDNGTQGKKAFDFMEAFFMEIAFLCQYILFTSITTHLDLKHLKS